MSQWNGGGKEVKATPPATPIYMMHSIARTAEQIWLSVVNHVEMKRLGLALKPNMFGSAGWLVSEGHW